MIESTTPDVLTINVDHVRQQFERRLGLADAEFLYGEIAQRMMDRLKLIRLDARLILDAGCGTGRRLTDLEQRFPNASIVALDHSERALDVARKSVPNSWHHKLRKFLSKSNSIDFVCADLSDTGLAAETFDMIWSNLAIHWHPRPHDVLAEWSRLLRPGGLVFFSCWGPATGIELRQAALRAGIKTKALPLVDMHDLGDLMLQNGLNDPVMDQETITLTYRDSGKLIHDAHILGGNPNPLRKATLSSRHWYERLAQSLEQQRDDQGNLKLTIELAYGHGWRSAIRRKDGETRISVQAITRK